MPAASQPRFNGARFGLQGSIGAVVEARRTVPEFRKGFLPKEERAGFIAGLCNRSAGNRGTERPDHGANPRSRH